MVYTTNHLMGAVMQMLALIGPAAHDVKPSDVMCLANVVYNESRGESIKGQMAVANVVVNRGGRRACATVKAKNQFYGYKPVKVRPEEWKSWASAVEISAFALSGYLTDVTNGANYFSKKGTKKPTGMGKHRVTLREGNHVFFRGEYDHTKLVKGKTSETPA